MVYIRKNQSKLTRTEKRRFVNAVLALKRSGEYDEFVRIHIEFYVSDGDRGLRVAHMAPSFLPWHRRFLLEFEQALQRKDPGVSLPYWDWTVDRTPASSLWAEDLLGGTGRRSDARVMTGPFAYRHGHWVIKERVTDAKFLTRELGRPHAPLELPTKKELAWATDDSVYDTEPFNSTSSSGFRNKLEGWTSLRGSSRWRNHNRVHRWVGGSMLGGASVNDPVFWLHHAFLDLVWSRWRAAHPDGHYQPAEPPSFRSLQRSRIVSRDEPMPPWDVKPSELEDHSGIYRYDA